MDDTMYHYVYVTSNSINKKIYIGLHSSDKPVDNYKGSGTYLKKAMKKYGRSNFFVSNRVYLESRELARELEDLAVRELISLGRTRTYNRAQGGTGAAEGRYNHFYGKYHTLETKNLIGKLAAKRVGKLNHFYGKHHSQSTKDKIRDIHKGQSKFTKKHLMRKSIESRLGWYITPYGCFDTSISAQMFTGLAKSTILKRCISKQNVIVKPNYQVPEKYWGKTWLQNGYYLLRFEDIE